MSIPKEPRQLMINLMYLVLTAMLALNVSAKIINAFFMIDKGIVASNKLSDDANQQKIEGFKEILKKPDYAKFRSLEPAADQIRSIVKDFNASVEDLKETLIKESGGRDPKHGDMPVGKKNKDVTTRILVNEGKGKVLKESVLATREKMLSLLKDVSTKLPGSVVKKEHLEKLEKAITLNITEDWKEDHESKSDSWEHYNFNQMPLAAVLPMLSKLQSDAKTTETAFLNQIMEWASAKIEITMDAFMPAVSPKKAYLIVGETYEADVFLASYSKTANNITLAVNGGTLPLKEGVGRYTASAGATGVQRYSVTASVKNPNTGEVKTFKKDFEYEVGQRSATVSADKMNVFYIGVDNPVTVSAAGVSSNQLQVSGSGPITLSPNGTNKYTVRASSVGEATITLSAPGLAASQFKFRCKRIPDPVVKLANKTSGKLGSGEMRAQQGLIPILENFDFDARCEVVGFEMARVAKRQDPMLSANQGGRFGGQSATMISQAAPGDIFYFNNVKVRCPGDAASREVNPLNFEIR